MKKYYHKPEENKFFINPAGAYISKSGEFYAACRADGSEITGVVIPINISIMSLKGMLPAGVIVYPTPEEVEIEKSLNELLKR
jgi:hypothetical protein